MNRRLRDAALAAATAVTATAAAVLAPAAPASAQAAAQVAAQVAAQAQPTPLGEAVSTHGGFGPWSLDATCHFGPWDTASMERRLHVQGVATAPGAMRTTIRCTVESGGGVWRRVFEQTSDGPVAVTYGAGYTWAYDYDRVCVSASAEFAGVDTIVAPEVCQES